MIGRHQSRLLAAILDTKAQFISKKKRMQQGESTLLQPQPTARKLPTAMLGPQLCYWFVDAEERPGYCQTP
jgi:hypothetical protein